MRPLSGKAVRNVPYCSEDSENNGYTKTGGGQADVFSDADQREDFRSGQRGSSPASGVQTVGQPCVVLISF